MHKIYVKENRRDNQEWKIQRNCQHWVLMTQNEVNNKKNPKNTTHEIKMMSNTDINNQQG